MYYREGEEDIEERSVLPKVRGSAECGHAGAALGRAVLDSCLRAGLSGTVLFLDFCKIGKNGAAGFSVGRELPEDRGTLSYPWSGLHKINCDQIKL